MRALGRCRSGQIALWRALSDQVVGGRLLRGLQVLLLVRYLILQLLQPHPLPTGSYTSAKPAPIAGPAELSDVH
jgi:hypothetical protein